MGRFANGTDRDRVIIAEWIRRGVFGSGHVTSPDSPARPVSQIVFDSTAIYSYGRHFPLASIARRSKNARPTIVLNGDVWRGGGGGWHSSRTGGHQADARHTASELAAYADAVVIPYSALDGTAIDRSSIVPIDVLPDRTVNVDRSSASLDSTPTARAVKRAERELANLWTGASEETRERVRESLADRRRALRELEPDSDGRYHWTESRHVLGECLFSAVVPSSRQVRRASELADMVDSIARARRYHEEYGAARGDSLGDTLERTIADFELERRETVTDRPRRIFLSSFDLNEPAPLYFLAEMPRGARPRTIAEAIDALAPRAVHAAMARGRNVDRQGDMFAIETTLTDADVYGAAITRARRSAWSTLSPARRGEVNYISPSDRRARARALYMRERSNGWTSPDHARFTRGEKIEAAREPSARMIELAEKARANELAAAIEARRYNRAITRAPGPRGAEAAWSSASLRHYTFNADYQREYDHDARRLEYSAMRSNGWTSPSGKGNRARRRAVALGLAPLELLEDTARPVKRRYPPRDRYSALRTLEEYPRRELERVQNAHRVNRANARPVGPDSAVNALRRARLVAGDVDRGAVRSALRLYHTAHTATEVVRVKGGRTYIRGVMYHEPGLDSDRRGGRDHVARPLGDRKTWYLVIRNTVPRARATNRGARR